MASNSTYFWQVNIIIFLDTNFQFSPQFEVITPLLTSEAVLYDKIHVHLNLQFNQQANYS